MATHEIVVLLLAWSAIFGLIVVVPWAVVRLVSGALEADWKSRIERWTPTPPKPGREERETDEIAVRDDPSSDREPTPESIHSDFEARKR